MNTHVILDGNNTAYRSAAVTQLTNSNGRDVSVPFGVLRTVKFLIEKLRPDVLSIVWDGGRSPRRVELLPEYKRSVRRAKNKEIFESRDIYRSIADTQYLMKLLGIPQYKMPHVEADDLIRSLVDKYKSTDVSTIIVSSDKDFIQLINKRTSIFNPITSTFINIDNIFDHVGFTTPQEYLEYHILCGDKSDNIPGVPGIGDKTARKLIYRYHNIALIVEAIDNSPDDFSKRERKIIEPSSIDRLRDNRELIDLRWNPYRLKISGNELSARPKAKYKKLREVLSSNRFKFNSILEDYNYWVLEFRKLGMRRSTWEAKRKAKRK